MSSDDTECLANSVYSCYESNCFIAETTDLLCINENCRNKITTCLQDEDCGSLYLNYLKYKQDCYNTYYVPSGVSQCRCKQEGDSDTYYDDKFFRELY